jgi:hypothetical protein
VNNAPLHCKIAPLKSAAWLRQPAPTDRGWSAKLTRSIVLKDGMRDLAAAADRIDNWIRRRVIVSCCGTHPSQSKLNSARHRRLGLSAIGQSLKDQYDALATPIPRISLHSSNDLKRRNADRPARRDRIEPIVPGRLPEPLMERGT